MSRTRTRFSRLAIITTSGVAVAAALTACGSSGSGSPSSSAAGKAGVASASTTTVKVGALSNGAAEEVDLQVAQVAKIRAELPAKIRNSGNLVIGLGLLPSGSPPLGFVGTDQRTVTGSEPDLGRLVAAVFGLKPVVRNATWENMFVGIDSGTTDAGFTNITDTEERKKKYDFACYRQDNLGFETLKSSKLSFTGDYHVLAGQTIAVGSGTNQEKILLAWQKKLQAEGKQLTVKYYPDGNSTYLALDSGKITAYFAPNPSVAYHVRQSASTPNPTRSAGTFSGAGASLQGLICATSKKGDGLAQPIADAINYLIKNGQYAKWLAAWNLSNEAVTSSKVNPPGLPTTNS